MRAERFFGIALAVALALCTWAAADDDPKLPRAQLEVEPQEARVGDALELTLEIRTSPESRVERPELGASGKLTFRPVSWEGPEEIDGELRWVLKGTVAAFETGDLEIPAAVARVVGPEGESTLRSEPVSIRIVSVLSGEDADPALAALKGPASIAPDYRALLTALGVVAGLLVVALAAWWLHRRYGRRFSAVAAPEDPFQRMPPHEWVYRELQRLLDCRLAEQGQVDRFFEELSHILKRYLGGRYRVDLMERTTLEVLPVLREVGAPRESWAPTRELLDRSDRVKFAGERPEPADCREAVEVVYRIVDATRPAEQRGAA